MNYFSLSLTALIPAIVLCIYIYIKDRVEKEPIGLLLLLFAAGGVAYLPAVICKEFGIKLIDSLFADQMIVGLTGIEGFTSTVSQALHGAGCAFIATALFEEIVKWVVLILLTSRNKNFSHLFDGVIYSVFVSLGFAAVENVRYAVMDGWGTFVLRAVTSVPSHLVFGVIMGFFYTLWNVYRIASVSEQEMVENGDIPENKPIGYMRYLVLALVCPVLVHGIYSFIRYFTSDILEDAFYILIAVMYILCLVAVNKISEGDSHEDSVARRIIKRRHPEIAETDIEIVPDGIEVPDEDNDSEGGNENG